MEYKYIHRYTNNTHKYKYIHIITTYIYCVSVCVYMAEFFILRQGITLLPMLAWDSIGSPNLLAPSP